MALRMLQCLLLLATSATLLQPSSAALRLFFFGDSLLDTGNANFLLKNPGQGVAITLPYGRLLSPRGPTGRFSDGKVFTDFLSEKVGLPTPPPILQQGANRTAGVNFATGGAGAAVGYGSSNLTVREQLNLFAPIANDITRAELANETVAVLSVGGNDWFTFFQNNPLWSFGRRTDKTAEIIVSAVDFAVRQLYSAGLRNIVVFNAPPLGCLPIVRDQIWWNRGCFKDGTNAAIAHNRRLQSAMSITRTQLTGLNLVVLDIYAAFYASAAAAKIPDNKGACCGAPAPTNGRTQCGPFTNVCADASQFMFWDHIHPTEAAIKRIFDRAWNGTGTTSPFNIRALFQRLTIPVAAL